MKSGKTVTGIIGLSVVLVSSVALVFTSLTTTRGAAQVRAAEDAASACTPATVQGTYGLVASGTLLGVGPATASGILTTNGAGGFTYSYTQNINGTVSSGTTPGGYTLSSNCSGTIKFPDGETLAAVVVSSGAEIDIQSTSPDLVETGVAKKL